MLSVAFKFHYFAHWKSNRLRTHQNVEAAIIDVQSEIPYSDLELFIYAFLSLLVFFKKCIFTCLYLSTHFITFAYINIRLYISSHIHPHTKRNWFLGKICTR